MSSLYLQSKNVQLACNLNVYRQKIGNALTTSFITDFILRRNALNRLGWIIRLHDLTQLPEIKLQHQA